MRRSRVPLARTSALGAVVPVHNEQELLGQSLAALTKAFNQLARRDVRRGLVVVLDACSDASDEIVRRWRDGLGRPCGGLEVAVINETSYNVGRARALGCATLLDRWSGIDPSRIWLATTDADSEVPQDWLVNQLEQHEAGVDHWFGRVAVADWSPHRDETKLRWELEYAREARPIHGANLGFNAAAYLAVGGFASVETCEDRRLHEALVALGAPAYFDATTHVVTSSRRRGRAPHGFANALNVIGAAVPTTAPR